MMKKFSIFFVFAVCSLTMCCVLCGAKKSSKAMKSSSSVTTEVSTNQEASCIVGEESPKLFCENVSVDMMKLSEAFGHLIARSLKNPVIEFNLESIIKGMRDCTSGYEAPMTEEEFEEIVNVLQNKAFQHVAEANLKAADEFMVENATAGNVVELEPGKLQYQVMKEGNDSNPVIAQNSTPMVHYKGMCLDGTVFGDSEQTGGPIAISLDEAIPGFGKGVVGMKVGEKRKLFVHPDLAYGVGGDLPPNSLLIFEVETVDSPALAENLESSRFANEAVR